MSLTVQSKKRKLSGSDKKAKSRRVSRGVVKSLKYHNFVRSCTFGQSYVVGMDLKNGFNVNGVTTGLFNMQFNFTLSGVNVLVGGVSSTTLSLPNSSEFTALYDQYRIDWVDCQFIFSNNMSNVTSPSLTLPVVYLAKDYDDSNLANYPDLQQYATQQTWQLGNEHGRNGIHHVRVKPNVDVALYQGVTTGYARGKPMFIDTASPQVPHYGVKIAYDPIYTPASPVVCGYLTVNFVYHMTLAHSK